MDGKYSPSSYRPPEQRRKFNPNEPRPSGALPHLQYTSKPDSTSGQYRAVNNQYHRDPNAPFPLPRNNKPDTSSNTRPGAGGSLNIRIPISGQWKPNKQQLHRDPNTPFPLSVNNQLDTSSSALSASNGYSDRPGESQRKVVPLSDAARDTTAAHQQDCGLTTTTYDSDTYYRWRQNQDSIDFAPLNQRAFWDLQAREKQARGEREKQARASLVPAPLAPSNTQRSVPARKPVAGASDDPQWSQSGYQPIPDAPDLDYLDIGPPVPPKDRPPVVRITPSAARKFGQNNIRNPPNVNFYTERGYGVGPEHVTGFEKNANRRRRRSSTSSIVSLAKRVVTGGGIWSKLFGKGDFKKTETGPTHVSQAGQMWTGNEKTVAQQGSNATKASRDLHTNGWIHVQPTAQQAEGNHKARRRSIASEAPTRREGKSEYEAREIATTPGLGKKTAEQPPPTPPAPPYQNVAGVARGEFDTKPAIPSIIVTSKLSVEQKKAKSPKKSKHWRKKTDSWSSTWWPFARREDEKRLSDSSDWSFKCQGENPPRLQTPNAQVSAESPDSVQLPRIGNVNAQKPLIRSNSHIRSTHGSIHGIGLQDCLLDPVSPVTESLHVRSLHGSIHSSNSQDALLGPVSPITDSPVRHNFDYGSPSAPQRHNGAYEMLTSNDKRRDRGTLRGPPLGVDLSSLGPSGFGESGQEVGPRMIEVRPNQPAQRVEKPKLPRPPSSIYSEYVADSSSVPTYTDSGNPFMDGVDMSKYNAFLTDNGKGYKQSKYQDTTISENPYGWGDSQLAQDTPISRTLAGLDGNDSVEELNKWPPERKKTRLRPENSYWELAKEGMRERATSTYQSPSHGPPRDTAFYDFYDNILSEDCRSKYSVAPDGRASRATGRERP